MYNLNSIAAAPRSSRTSSGESGSGKLSASDEAGPQGSDTEASFSSMGLREAKSGGPIISDAKASHPNLETSNWKLPSALLSPMHAKASALNLPGAPQPPRDTAPVGGQAPGFGSAK